MCFSATASFGASAVLGVIAVVAIRKARTNGERVFACIPLLFAVQQLAEGFIWLSFKYPAWEDIRPALTYVYLFFAMMLWPVWIPLSVWMLESDARRKKWIGYLLLIGVLVFLGIAYILFTYPAKPMAMEHHLHYRFGFPTIVKQLIWLFDILYILATILSPFLSVHRRMKWLGVIFLGSYIFASIFYQGFVISVWCFFAAGLSVIVYWILAGIQSGKYGEKSTGA